MNPIKLSDEINNDRRRFLGTAAMTVAAAEHGMVLFSCLLRCFPSRGRPRPLN